MATPFYQKLVYY